MDFSTKAGIELKDEINVNESGYVDNNEDMIPYI